MVVQPLHPPCLAAARAVAMVGVLYCACVVRAAVRGRPCVVQYADSKPALLFEQVSLILMIHDI